MRKSVVFIALVLTALAFGAGEVWAAEITHKHAKSICQGKPALPNGGCNWCGRTNCTSVNCDKAGCDVTIVKTGTKKEVAPPPEPPKGKTGTAPPPADRN
jgi:hypothetical protein